MTPPFFERIFTGGEFSIRGFDIRSVTPWAFTRTPGLDGAGNPIIDPTTGMPVITEQLIPVGGDTSALFTGEYRIPLVGPLQAAAFVDLGSAFILRKDNLSLLGENTSVQLLNSTNDVWRMSTGLELQFNLPVINQPFRLIFAYNPLRLDTSVVYRGIPSRLHEPVTNIKFSVGYNF